MEQIIENILGSVNNLITNDEKDLLLTIIERKSLHRMSAKYLISIEGVRQRCIKLSKKICRISKNTGNIIDIKINQIQELFDKDIFLDLRDWSLFNDIETLYISDIYKYAFIGPLNKYSFKKGSSVEIFYSNKNFNTDLIKKIDEIGTPILLNKQDIITLNIFVQYIKNELVKNGYDNLADNDIRNYLRLIGNFSISKDYICHSNFKLLPEDGLKGKIREILIKNNSILHYKKIFEIITKNGEYNSIQSMYNALMDSNMFVKLGNGFYTIK